MDNTAKRDRWLGQTGQSVRTTRIMDVDKFYSDLHIYKESFDPPLTWRRVASVTGISPSTFTRLNRGHACNVDAFLTLCWWGSLDPSAYSKLREE